MSFIVEYWVQELFGIIVAVLGVLFRHMQQWKQEQDAIKEGVIAILHDRLFQTCSYHICVGYIPLAKYEEIVDNVKMLYETYHTLGGNGTGTDIYNRFNELPIQ